MTLIKPLEQKSRPLILESGFIVIVAAYFTKLALNSTIAAFRVAAVQEVKRHSRRPMTLIKPLEQKSRPLILESGFIVIVAAYFTKLALNSTIAAFRVAAVSSEKSLDCAITTGTSGYLSCTCASRPFSKARTWSTGRSSRKPWVAA